MNKNTITRFLPLIIFVAVFGLLGKMLLTDRNPAEIKSVLINQPVRPFTLEGFVYKFLIKKENSCFIL